MAKLELLAGERQTGESAKAVQACNDYLRMGPGRSLAKLLRRYSKTPQNSAAPTGSIHTLQKWSQDHEWAKRAEAYDAELEEQKNARRQKELSVGLALDFMRVRELKRLARLLKGELYRRDDAGKLTNVWLADMKLIGRGEHAERVDIERFNPALIEQYRDTLDDLARETGGRRQKVEHSGEDGRPIEHRITNLDELLSKVYDDDHGDQGTE